VIGVSGITTTTSLDGDQKTRITIVASLADGRQIRHQLAQIQKHLRINLNHAKDHVTREDRHVTTDEETIEIETKEEGKIGQEKRGHRERKGQGMINPERRGLDGTTDAMIEHGNFFVFDFFF